MTPGVNASSGHVAAELLAHTDSSRPTFASDGGHGPDVGRPVSGRSGWLGRLVAGAILAVAGATASAMDLADAVDRVRPSIVGVGTHAATRSPPAVLAGTGFAVGDGRSIATNLHVADRTLDSSLNEKLVVFIGRGTESVWREATIVARDDTHDLCLLRIAGTPLATVTLSTGASPREGTGIALTGFPIGTVLGLYPATHHGIVAALTPIAMPAPSARALTPSRIAALREPFEVLQLDATAYPGNSGSPVFLQDGGAVVGVVNSVFIQGKKEDVLTHPSAISYAIPVRYLRELMDASTAGSTAGPDASAPR